MTNSGYAKAPFDHAAADIILRSSDGVDSCVLKLSLSLASSFFETLFNLPNPNLPQSPEANKDQEFRDHLPVIPVTEDSKTLDLLLRFCYPCTLADDPKIDVFNNALGILEASRKYCLDLIEEKAYQAIMRPEFLKMEPLRCFAIMHRGRLREETQLAAKSTLTQPLIPSWCQEIELLPTTDPLSLLTYHKECGDAVYALRLDLSWITSHYRTLQACPLLSNIRLVVYVRGREAPDTCCTVLHSNGGKILWRKHLRHCETSRTKKRHRLLQRRQCRGSNREIVQLAAR